MIIQIILTVTIITFSIPFLYNTVDPSLTGTINVNESGIYFFIFAVVMLIWGLIFLTAKIDNDNLWINDAKKVRELEKAVDRIGKQNGVRKKGVFGSNYPGSLYKLSE